MEVSKNSLFFFSITENGTIEVITEAEVESRRHKGSQPQPKRRKTPPEYDTAMGAPSTSNPRKRNVKINPHALPPPSEHRHFREYAADLPRFGSG